MLCHMLFLCVGGYTAPAAVGRAFRGPGVLLQRGTFMTAPDPAQPEQGLAAPEQRAGRATAAATAVAPLAHSSEDILEFEMRCALHWFAIIKAHTRRTLLGLAR